MKMGKTLFTFGVVLLVAFLFGCDSNGEGNGEKGNGDVISQERTANNFNAVILDGVGNVNVHHSENYKVVVTTDSNNQDIITIEVNGNNLHIDQKKTNGFKATKLEIDVYLPELKSISLNGFGNFKINNGNASQLDFSLSGMGNIDAQNFQVQNVTIKHSGVGDAKIWATNTLNGSFFGVGKILYKGNPTIDVNKKSSVRNIKPLNM